MSADRSRTGLVPAWARNLPADLLGAVATVFAMWIVLSIPALRASILRPVFALPLLLFVPGYVLVAVLYPERSRSETTSGSTTRRPLDVIERVALSGAMSPVVVVLLAFLLNFTRWGFRLVPVLAAVSVTVVGLAVLAGWRRLQLPQDQRPSFGVTTRAHELVRRARSPASTGELLLNLGIVLALVVAVASVGFAIETRTTGDSYTELQLLTVAPDGDLIATDPPSELTVGTNESLVVGVSNHEYERTEYTLLIQLQRTETSNDTVRVLEREQIDRTRVTLEHNETWLSNRTLTPPFAGERLRLVFLLYRGGPPPNPTEANAYRWAHLWVDVREPGTDQERLVRS